MGSGLLPCASRIPALLGFSLLSRGFTHAALRARMAPLMGHTLHDWTHDLCLLRGLIERIRRYRVTETGSRTALSYHRTYVRVLRPPLSVTLDRARPGNRRLRKAITQFDAEVYRLWHSYSIAA